MPAPNNATTNAADNEQPKEIVDTASLGTSSNTTVSHIIPPPPDYASHRYHVNFESFSGYVNTLMRSITKIVDVTTLRNTAEEPMPTPRPLCVAFTRPQKTDVIQAMKSRFRKAEI
ncbi:Hypothetical predicted protein [Mytilus galloprovincialis]|uniref:Uncharacterized protein n=1 Tax=Mytilus galloprovincialis TaxID=29158 RepID=A0A8B6BKJ3_MYTGA|nr:Hypothetical predicted protein [Mytilus galloprovincialis]